MINVTLIKLSEMFKHKQSLSEANFTQEGLKDIINNYRYPLGILQRTFFSGNNRNPLYTSVTVKENLSYIRPLVYEMLGSYYTQDELKICSALFAVWASTAQFTLEDSMIDVLNDALTIASNLEEVKPEIQYIIEEIKYLLLVHYTHSEGEHPEVESLLADLGPIEQSHNQFKIDALK